MAETLSEDGRASTPNQMITPNWVHSIIGPKIPRTPLEEARLNLAAEHAIALSSEGLSPEEVAEHQEGLQQLVAGALFSSISVKPLPEN